MSEEQSRPGDPTGRVGKEILIVSPRKLDSELLAYALEREACQKCQIIPDLSQLKDALPTPPAGDTDAAILQGKTLLLIDCVENDFDRIMRELSDQQKEPSENLIVAVYNVYPGLGYRGRGAAIRHQGILLQA